MTKKNEPGQGLNRTQTGQYATMSRFLKNDPELLAKVIKEFAMPVEDPDIYEALTLVKYPKGWRVRHLFISDGKVIKFEEPDITSSRREAVDAAIYQMPGVAYKEERDD